MKDVLSDLLILFCGDIKFAVMSYGAIIERNICFKCNQSNRPGDNIDYDELECIEGDNNPSPHIIFI